MNCGIELLVLLNTVLIFLIILEMSGLLNILDSNKKSGFNNPNDIEVVRHALARYKIMYNTDYNEIVIMLVSQMPHDKRMIYYNDIAMNFEDRQRQRTARNLAPPPLREPELSRYNEMVKQGLAQVPAQALAQAPAQVPAQAPAQVQAQVPAQISPPTPEPAPAREAATTNWAGNKFSTNGRCGRKFNNTACPDNQCCSVYGWCGTTRAFCGNMMSKGQFNGKKP
jgi:hypothetical protein